jgi:hypothetical protein
LAAEYPNLEATIGLVVMHRSSKFRGAVVRIEHDGGLVLRSPNSGAERVFTMSPGAFSLQGETITLVRPKPPKPSGKTTTQRTASGSTNTGPQQARVARASRILVEGMHDAELVEKVWGDDLRVEGIVVEHLDGIDHLDDAIRAFDPSADAKLAVLVDHLVPGSKEARIADSIRNRHVLIAGTPYVDVWQAIRPKALGIDAWPNIPKGQDWKAGMCRFFGESEPGRLWKKLLASVTSYVDLEPSMVGAVESLIDFVTTPAQG